MSLVFLKSSNNKVQPGFNNPNEPYRFSNYLTQELKIPPNSQIAYVSSQFHVNSQADDMSDVITYLQTTNEDKAVLNMPVSLMFEKSGDNIGSWTEVLNKYALSANEFGMDGDYTGTKYENQVLLGETQLVSNSGIQLLHDPTNDKAVLRTKIRLAEDQFNLYFNACRTNPSYNFSGSGGGIYPNGLNFTDKVDTKFQADSTMRSSLAPSGASFFNGNNYGFRVGLESNLFNARNRVYEGGANFYNTGFSSTGLDGSLWGRWNQLKAGTPLPGYNVGAWSSTISGVGIKKSCGSITPSTDPQQSNTGGHIFPGGFSTPSGGYALWTNTNASVTDAEFHWDTSAVPPDEIGFTGLVPCSIGVHSQPFIRQRGYDQAIAKGDGETLARDITTQYRRWMELCDLNASPDPDEPIQADARFLFGVDIRETGTGTDKDLVIQAKMLDWENSPIDSQYEDIGNPLSIRSLSKGINTAPDTPFTFSNDKYMINVYDVASTTRASIPLASALFLRWRWLNKCQMCIEFTLSTEGFFGTYDSATDTPYEPSQQPEPLPPPTSQTIRLDATTTNDVVQLDLNETINFLDSGGAGGDYNPNEQYNIVFVAPPSQNLLMSINTFEFEQSNIAYDRLGIRVSDDGVNWTNISEKGFQSMQVENNPNNPSDSNERIFSVPGQPQNSNDGWVFPGTTTMFSSTLGGDLSKTYNFGARYMQFRFISDGSGQEPGWDLNIFATTSAENDPRDRWCLLATMDVSDELKYFLPTTNGDICLAQHIIAAGDNTDHPRTLTKGWYDPRETNRYFRDNNNGGGRQPAPYEQNKFFDGFEDLGILRLNLTQPSNPDETSQELINAEYIGSPLPSPFNSSGVLKDENYWLGSYYVKDDLLKVFMNSNGVEVFEVGEPAVELAYKLGFITSGSNEDVLEIPLDSSVGDESTRILVPTNDITLSSDAFSNHIQISNLPITSANGVVSSITKTIYIVNTLCIDQIHDTASYRFYCDKAPYPVWIDLNNLQEIQLNKIDVYITDDNNRPQKALVRDSEVVIMFRQKEQGVLPNSIPGKSMSVTRTY